MKILRAILFALLTLTGPLHGQTAEKSDTPVMGQIAIKPARASWVETFGVGSKQNLGEYPVKIARLVYDGKEFSATTEADGRIAKRWNMGKMAVMLGVAQDPEEVCIDYLQGIHRPSVKMADGRERFQGLEWISLANFQGKVNSGGTECWYFESTRSLPSGAQKDIRKVWINIQTGLPVARVENGMQVVYHFEPPPTAPAPVSPAVQSFLKRYQEKMRRYSPAEVR